MNGVSEDAIRNILDAVETGGVSILAKTTASGNSVTFQTKNGKKINVPSQKESAHQDDARGDDPSGLQVDPSDLKSITF